MAGGRYPPAELRFLPDNPDPSGINPPAVTVKGEDLTLAEHGAGLETACIPKFFKDSLLTVRMVFLSESPNIRP
jgi:hypothetical protein